MTGCGRMAVASDFQASPAIHAQSQSLGDACAMKSEKCPAMWHVWFHKITIGGRDIL